jgi:SAM-dependent methyltransferase
VKSIPRKNTRLRGVLEVLPHLTNGDRCLDIGTASAGFALFFATTGDWTFLEPDASHLRTAKRLLKGRFVEKDGETFLRDENQTFNLITALAVLYYIPNRKEFLDLVRQRLAAGGRFLVSGDDISCSPFFGVLRKTLGIEALDGGAHDLGYKDLRRILESAGVSVRCESHSTGPATLAFQTALDGLLVAFSQKNGPSERGRLTLPLEGRPRRLQLKILALLGVRVVTEVVKLVDALFWFLPRYDYVICAELSDPPGPGKVG